MILKMMLVYFLMLLTGNPILVIFLLLILYGALDWGYFGYFPRVSGWFKRYVEIRDLRRILEVNPHDARSQVALGRALFLNGAPGEAIFPLEAAFQKMKDQPEVHYYLGLSCLATGKEERGKELLLTTISMDPRFQYGEPYLKLGEFFFKKGEYEQSRQMLETFCSIHTSSSEGYYHLGMAQLALGDRDGASRSLRKSIEVYKISPRYKKQVDRKWRWKAGRSLATL